MYRLIVIAMTPFLLALTPYEATLYGSNILVCNETTYLKYWTTHKKKVGNSPAQTYIFDLMKKKSYRLDECEIYKCSPAPGRMYGCAIPYGKE